MPKAFLVHPPFALYLSDAKPAIQIDEDLSSSITLSSVHSQVTFSKPFSNYFYRHEYLGLNAKQSLNGVFSEISAGRLFIHEATAVIESRSLLARHV